MAVKEASRDYRYPVACASAFGRFFYAVDSLVYYTQVILKAEDAGRCYQNNDPTSSEFPDLLDTDGGVLELEDSRRIKALQSFRNGVLVFAGNGVWYISNPDGGFKATAYNVEKISERGLDSERSIVEAEGSIFYFSNNGVMQVVVNEFNNLQVVDISEQSIRTYYIERLAGGGFAGVYDEADKKIVWWCPSSMSRGLVYDLPLQAFYPQKNASPDWKVKYPFSISNTVYYPSSQEGETSISYNFAFPQDRTFKDFGVDQEAYLIGGYESLGKFSNNKAITQAKVFFNKTETEITARVNGEYVYDFPSGCLFQARWDFDKSNAYNHYTGIVDGVGNGKVMQLYKPLQRGFIPDAYPYTFDTGERVISNKFNIRGNGDAVQFVFQAEPEKDLQILGYSVSFTMRGRM